MTDKRDHIELISKAQLGDRESLNRLAEVARVRLREYVLRLTLQEDLTQDIVQESILEMFKVFHKLKKADRFWAWLDGIAFNKVRSHYSRRWRHKTVSLSQIGCDVAAEVSEDVVANMVSRELKQIVLRSMQELQPRHRAVLTMRCYNQMPYAQIAKLMGCTEFGVQSLFYRAKKALAKKLSSHGLSKGYLLTALVLFGKLTATSEAAAAQVSVTAATIKVGAAASLAAMATSKTAVVSLAAAGMIAAGTATIAPGIDKVDNELQKPHVLAPLNTPLQTQASKGMEQCWYFLPEGVGGPVMTRLLKFGASGKSSYCRYLQNQHANYYCDEGSIYLNNSRMYNPDLSVRRLPTDGPDLSQFISHVEGKQADMEYVSSRKKGLLVISKRLSGRGDTIWRIDRHFNVLEEEYFQSDWPESAKIVDNRDAMHERGWTYFRIAGHVNGKEVSGTGRIPFVYATSKQFGPWLRLQLVDGSTIVDNGSEACVLDESGKVATRYQGGSFFKGLIRPWMGLHAIDTVRRDAAEEQVWFEAKGTSSGRAEVVLTLKEGRMVYAIDMEADVIEKITFSASNGAEGELRISYLQNLDDVGDEFTPPRTRSYRRPQQEPPGMLWIVKLANGRW